MNKCFVSKVYNIYKSSVYYKDEQEVLLRVLWYFPEE